MPATSDPHRLEPSDFLALPARLADKADPARIGDDAVRFAAIAAALAAESAAASARRDELRRLPGTHGQAALERDLEVHRLTARLRTLGRFGVDACLGRVMPADGEPLYIGRFGLTGPGGERLLVDWRTPAAEPFFAATLAHPQGLRSRRRYRWAQGRVVDYWDEVFASAGEAGASGLSPDDQSAFIASLGASRSSRMRDVLGTIQADQDAVIRADSRGVLVVDGGPGTGKTVVALHRAAYLQYADPRMGVGKGGVLVVGPHAPYLSYVEDVLPSLGEEGVQVCTIRDLVGEGGRAGAETDPRVARLKSSGRLADAVEAAVRGYERPPTADLLVETPWGEVLVTDAEWTDAFESADPALTHDDARDQVWGELLERLVDLHGSEEDGGADAGADEVRRAIARDAELGRAFTRAWPILDPARVVADLLSVPAYLRSCAPWLSDAEVALLQRHPADAWTTADLPLLDAARQRIGDPERVRLRRLRERALADEREVRERVVDELVAADDGDLKLMSILRGQDAENSLVDDAALPSRDADALAGPFAHIIVDEAQELTDAEWAMLRRRCPSGSFTVVGDRAQARTGFAESWEERLRRVGFARTARAKLTFNYRTPAEVMEAAAPGILSALPDANVPVSVRRSGLPVRIGTPTDLEGVLDDWIERHDEGTAVVIGATPAAPHPRVRTLSPELVKGLEFDLVVLVDPAQWGDDLTGAVDRYVAMTRTTRELVVLRPG